MAAEEVTMDKEDLWKRFQTHMGYTDAEDGNGQLITRECPEKMCIFALAALESPVNQIYERFIAHSDPNNERTAVV
jgi:hypothetical protein